MNWWKYESRGKTMTITAKCEECNAKFKVTFKPTEFIICPYCKTRYNAIRVMNDPENIKAVEELKRRNNERRTD